MKTHFIFDFDDTISSSYEFNQNMFYETFLPHVPNIDEDFVRNVHKESRGKAMDEQFQMVIDKFDLPLSAEQLTAENEQMHIEKIEGLSLFAGVNEFFKKLTERDKKISICTNRQYGSLNVLVKKHKIGKYLDNIISCKDEGYEKPDPTCLLRLVSKYNETKDNFIYFGDSKTDFEFATNAGMDFVIVDHYLNGKNFYKMIIKSFL